MYKKNQNQKFLGYVRKKNLTKIKTLISLGDANKKNHFIRCNLKKSLRINFFVNYH